jgi:hypothetical protein
LKMKALRSLIEIEIKEYIKRFSNLANIILLNLVKHVYWSIFQVLVSLASLALSFL